MYIKIEKIFVDQEIMQYDSVYVGSLYTMDFSSEVTSEICLATLSDRHFADRLKAKEFYENIQDCFPVLIA